MPLPVAVPGIYAELVVAASLGGIIDELIGSIEAGDYPAFRRGAEGLAVTGPQAGPAELSAAVTRLAPVIPRVGGPFAKVVVFAGALVEWGGSPLPLAQVTPARAATDLEMSALFPGVWARASGGQPLPDQEDEAAEPGAAEVLGAAADRLGLPGPAARQFATAWFHAGDWMLLMIALLSIREFRAAMASRERLRTAAAAMADRSARAGWLYGLTVVLDGEPLIVLDPGSGRGFHLTMSGIGDNYQLHTLLADRLAARVPGLEPPEHHWVAAATDAPPTLPGRAIIQRRCRLFNGHGSYVYPAGRPADIQPLDDARIVVLHPPLGRFGWASGRIYEHMRPTLTLDHPRTYPRSAQHESASGRSAWRQSGGVGPPCLLLADGDAGGSSAMGRGVGARLARA
jgi:hypothetical protein